MADDTEVSCAPAGGSGVDRSGNPALPRVVKLWYLQGQAADLVGVKPVTSWSSEIISFSGIDAQKGWSSRHPQRVEALIPQYGKAEVRGKVG